MTHILTPRETLQQVLDAIDGLYEPGELQRVNEVLPKLQALLAAPCEPQQKPAAWATRRPDGELQLFFLERSAKIEAEANPRYGGVIPLYTAPPAERDALAKDAARYRWLRDRVYKDGGDLAMSVEKAYDLHAMGNLNAGLDAALDAAMGGEK